MKKIISFFTAVSVAAAIYAGAAAADENTEVSAENAGESVTEVEDPHEVKLLKALGIFDNDVSGEKVPTRAEILVPLLRLAEAVEYAASDELYSFRDVSASHEYASQIYTAKELGYIDGNGMEYYHPDEPIDFYAAVKLMVAVCGYSNTAEKQGGYPSGYLSVAGTYKMLEGISSEEITNFNYNTFAKLTENALDVYTAYVTVSGENKAYYGTGNETLLNRLDIEKTEGIVTENEYTSLTAPKGYAEGNAVIGDVRVDAADSGIGSYIGCNVCAYVKMAGSPDEGRVCYAYPKDNEVITIPAEDIVDIGFENQTAEYDSGTRTKRVNLKKYFDFIYNGFACNEYNNSLLTPDSGSVTLIDNDKNSVFDVVIVESYYDVVVSSVSDETIYNKLGTAIDMSDTAMRVAIFKDGVQIQADTLLEWDSLLVLDSSYKLTKPFSERAVTMYASDNRAMGKVSAKNEENGREYIIIEGDSYPVSKTLINSKSTTANVPAVGAEGIFIINAHGEIAAFTVSSLDIAMAQFAYLTRAAISEDDEDVIFFKLFTADDEFIRVEGAERVLIDGVSYKETTQIMNALSDGGVIKNQLVCYKLNDNGDLYYIDTAERGTSENSYTLSCGYDSSIEGDIRFKIGYKVFEDRIHTAADTVVFCVPVNDTDDESLYGISDCATNFQNDKLYLVDAYYTDDSAMNCKVLVYHGDAAQKMEESNLLVVEKVYVALDEDETAMEFLKGYDRYGERILKSDSNEFSAAGIDKGDIINYSSTGKDMLATYQFIYDYSEDKFMFEQNPTGDFTQQYRKMYGSVYEKSGSKFRIVCGDPGAVSDSAELEIKDIMQYRSYTYDSETETVAKATAADLRDYLSVRDDCTKVILTQGYGDPISMILYK